MVSLTVSARLRVRIGRRRLHPLVRVWLRSRARVRVRAWIRARARARVRVRVTAGARAHLLSLLRDLVPHADGDHEHVGAGRDALASASADESG